MIKKRIVTLLLILTFIIPGAGVLGTVEAAEPGNIALRRQAYASMYQNVPGIGSSSANSSWATSNTATTLPSYDETAMLVVDGIIGNTAAPLQYPTLQAMNINGTTTASEGVSAVTTSNLGNMIDGQSTTSGTATLAATSASPISATNPLIIKATLPKPEKVVSYSLIQQPNTTGGLGSKPHAWKLQASKTGGNDTAEWVDIDTFVTAQNPGYGTLSIQRTATPFNGRDIRYFDATGYNAFYSYNGSTPGTGNPKRSTTCDDYYQYYRLVITRTNQTSTTSNCAVTLCDIALVAETPGGGLRNALRAPFISRWTSTANPNQWLYIDLGDDVSYNSVKLHWGPDSFPTAYTIQVADDVTYNYGNGGGTGADAVSRWRTVQTVSRTDGGVHDVTFETQTARYVRINMTARVTGSSNYKLYEFEVFGARGAAPYKNPERPAPSADGRQELTGGDWTIARAEYMIETGEQLSVGTYDDSSWIPAKVPGTALMSHVKAGIIPDTNFDMNLQQVSDTYFYSDWWYRTSFDIPASKAGQNVYVNFDGINWKAKVFVNGHAISSGFDIEGAYIRGKLDISAYANYGGKNHLAVLVIPVERYGTPHSKSYTSCFDNGGLIGADNPTFHASINWDWIPTIRGRDTGIYDNVFVSYSGGIDLIDPWVVTEFDKLRVFNDNDLDSNITPSDDPAYDFSIAHTTLKTEVKNTTNAAVDAVVSGTYSPGNIPFSKAVSIPAGATVHVEIPVDIIDPDIWWPNTYGDQPLYTAAVKVSAGGVDSDVNTFRFGVRKLVYTYTGSFSQTGNFSSTVAGDHAFSVYCNGVRIYCRGGNWGMDDSNVDLSYEDYRVRVKLHAEENFTMIRNWVGMTGKEAFWDACDEYGILVWDDFWLANPYDGPDPLDNEMFLKNAEDKIRVVRKHASEAVYCARNEGIVTRPLDLGIQQAIEKLDGTRPYIRSSNSAVWGVNGHGPYAERERKQYYNGNAAANFQLHTERGQHVVPNHEVLTKYFRPENMWPGFSSASTTAHPWRVNAIAANVWGVHDFFMGGNGPATDFFSQLVTYANMTQLNSRFNNLEAFCTVSQLPNYDLHRAMFEGFVEKKGSGLLMWMSMSAWPSFAWRTFDYFYDTSSAYFGIKKASEPLAIIWNPTNSAAVTSTSNSNTYNPFPGGIAVANNTGKVQTNIRAVAKIYSMHGELLKNVADVAIPKLSVDQVMRISTATNANLWPSGSTRIKFLKLEVFDENGDLITDNFYWRDTIGDTGNSSTPDYTQLQNLPDVFVVSSSEAAGSDATSDYYKVKVENVSDSVAIQVRVKASDPVTGEMILPTYYSDNYFCLLPGESKVVGAEIERLYFDGTPEFSISGFNVLSITEDELPDYVITDKCFTFEWAEGSANLDDGEVKFQATFRSFRECKMDVNVILAVYKKDRFVGMADVSKSLDLATGTRETIVTPGFLIKADDPDLMSYSVKGFIWRGDDFVPLTEAESSGVWYGARMDLCRLPGVIATASDSDIPPANLIDGQVNYTSYQTRWESTTASGQKWVKIDLGGLRTFDEITIDWLRRNATNFRVEVSNDDSTWVLVEAFTEAPADFYQRIILGESVTARYVRLTINSFVANAAERFTGNYSYNAVSIFAIEVFGYHQAPVIKPSPATDIAVGKFVHASSEELDQGVYRFSDYVVNGIGEAANNRWASVYSDPQWIYIDLGEERTIAKIELIWEAAYGRNYTIEIASEYDMGTVEKRNSSSGVVETVPAAIPKNWETITTVTNNSSAGLKEYLYSPAHTARFVRMHGTSRGTSYGYSLFAFRVFERLN